MAILRSKNLILVINAGSSSLKYQLFIKKNIDYQILSRGIYESIGVPQHSTMTHVTTTSKKSAVPIKDHQVAIKNLMHFLQQNKLISNWNDLQGIGHRIVNVGPKFVVSQMIDQTALIEMGQNIDFAPLHNEPALTTIKALMKHTTAPNIGVFDISCHRFMPPENYLYPVPYEWFTKYKIRRYGMHGTNYYFVLQQLAGILHKSQSKINTIICHLGNGASICGIKNGKSIITSMGFSPLEGLMMGTRSGDIDPGIGQYLFHKTNMSLSQFVYQLNHESGLKAISGVAGDMRLVYEHAQKGNERCQLAIKMFVSRVCKFISYYQNEIGAPLDAVVFTGGIGENASYIRKLVIEKLYTLRLSLDDEQNEIGAGNRDYGLISDAQSALPVFVIKANEELFICQEVERLTSSC